ncbi:MAG: beta-galactosidase subunit alpha, partial [Anaerolineales bacterium]|nr:beta-galactosidase subunit alpha [Anaerolineales bacterium]
DLGQPWSAQSAASWRKAGLDRLEHTLRHFDVTWAEPSTVQVAVGSWVAARGQEQGFEVEMITTLRSDGSVLIDTKVTPQGELPPLPRLGLQMALPGRFERFTWYGRGPHETYPDRKVGAQVGIFNSTVTEQYVPYIVPQENGNKTDVRWAALTDEAGLGLLVVAGPTEEGASQWLNVSALHYTPEDLTCAQHTHELEPCEEVVLHLDCAQSGLGGASCGPGTLEQYLVPPRATSWQVCLKPFSASEVRLAELARALAAGH